MVAAQKGYKIILTMSEGMSEERKKILKSFGAKLILTPKKMGTDGAIIKAHKILKREPKKYWMPNQFSNYINPETHYNTTAKEILNDIPSITHFIAGIGTSGTIMGVSKRLREYNPNIQTIAVEPLLGHKIQGLKNMEESIIPEIYNSNNYNEKINIKDKDVYNTVKKL